MRPTLLGQESSLRRFAQQICTQGRTVGV